VLVAAKELSDLENDGTLWDLDLALPRLAGQSRRMCPEIIHIFHFSASFLVQKVNSALVWPN